MDLEFILGNQDFDFNKKTIPNKMKKVEINSA